MTASLRRFAWPLGVSLAAHALLGAWLLVKPAKPAAPRSAPATLSLRVMVTPAAMPATVVSAAAPKPVPPRKRPPKPLPGLPTKVPKSPRAVPTEPDEPVTAKATETAVPAQAPVSGVAFAPPRLGLPFGTAARSTWTPRPATVAAVPPTATGSMMTGEAGRLRQQSLDGLAHQVAEWTAPDRVESAQCRVSAEAESECDPAALADALAQRLQSLREAWAAYRHLAPEAPATLDVAYADGHFSLDTPAR